ncbi:hypothetical protein [Reichenbachiella versicolor]|uniref:hypothetical protein n=1 Tax=Reichenbachiella versicolor TaxID=1821036 RepID=UPI000D6DE283|nr:hypothetical protein [Reichenbachiella versicolor]
MLVAFEELPETARVWVYQANRKLTKEEQSSIDIKSSQFLEQWAAHGAPLKSSFQILHDQFLVISVDEGFNAASGCSIDSSVGLIRDLQSEFSIDFFDRTKICFLKDNEVFGAPMTELKSLIADGQIEDSTLTFNNLVQNIQEFKNNWVVPAKESWIKRYF